MARGAKTTEIAGSAGPSTDAVDDSATEGQRLLRVVDESLAAIAKRVGVSKSLVGHWRTGHKLPAPEMRRVLATLYGIPADSWDARPAGSARPAASKSPKATVVAASSKPTNRDGAEAMLQAILDRRSSGSLTVQEFTRLVDAEAKARKLIQDFDEAEQLTETRIVQSSTMRKIRDAAIASLEPWPDALRAFLAALGVKA